MLFRKIVSNISFSPALLNQLGFYTKRLQREQATRRLGLIFTVLALIVQTFALMSPPEPALAASSSNIIFNGANSKEDLLSVWDRNADGNGHKDIQQIFRFFFGQDFSRKDIENTQKGSFGSRDKVNGGRIMNLSREERTTDSERKAYSIRDVNGTKQIIWANHLDAYDHGANRTGRGSIYNAFIGSHKGIWFAIMLDCGNMAIPDTINVPPINPQLIVKATCREITGYAYDQSNLKANLKVYIYINGGPNDGDKYPVTANLATPDDGGVEGNHGYKLTVPTQYHTGQVYPYTVVAMPSFPENHSAQLSGKIDTTSCKPPEPVAQCTTLSTASVNGQRTKFKFTAKASVSNGAKVTGYRYTVTDQNAAKVLEKTYTSTDVTHTTEELEFTKVGTYSVKVTVLTSAGEKTAAECAKTFTVVDEKKCVYNPQLPVNDKDCKPCPGDSSIWYKDAECAPEIVKTKTVKNLTQNNNNANGTVAKAGDRLQYELFVENVGKVATTVTMDENLGDVLEYANLTDLGDNTTGVFNKTTKTLTWKDVKLEPGQKITKTIAVLVKDVIPSTPRSVGNLESYDCQMGNAFGGTSVVVKVTCAPDKVVENTVSQLPNTGTGTNVIFSIALLMVVTYFYMRSRQMNKEVQLIKKEFNYGTI